MGLCWICFWFRSNHCFYLCVLDTGCCQWRRCTVGVLMLRHRTTSSSFSLRHTLLTIILLPNSATLCHTMLTIMPPGRPLVIIQGRRRWPQYAPLQYVHPCLTYKQGCIVSHAPIYPQSANVQGCVIRLPLPRPVSRHNVVEAVWKFITSYNPELRLAAQPRPPCAAIQISWRYNGRRATVMAFYITLSPLWTSRLHYTLFQKRL